MDRLKSYFGKAISTFSFSNEILSFEFSDGDKLDLYARGDCCSSSWFEQISGEEALEPGAVLNEIEFISLKKVIKHNPYLEYEKEDFEEFGTDENKDVEKFYGLKIITSKGYADVDMRNNSNGYYGGYIVIHDDDQYGMDTIHPKD
jgi:hypothetical protein